jgi:phage baseplate assembly protein W
MSSYSFKSVGKTVQVIEEEKLTVTNIPIGIKTPLRLGENGDGLFAMHTSLLNQIEDNFRNLLLTNWGERIPLYDFGANLRELTTELVSQEDFDKEAMTRIKAAISKWMSYIEPQTFESKIDHEQNKNTGIVRIKITYNIPLINVSDRAIEVVLWVI